MTRVASLLGLMLMLELVSQPSPVLAQARTTAKINPQRRAYFGDLHLHTSYSFDAYTGVGGPGPDEAYRFARGETVEIAGIPHTRTTPPLDFLAVTDHSEWMAIPEERETSDIPAPLVEFYKKWREWKWKEGDPFIRENMEYGWPSKPVLTAPVDMKRFTRPAWQREIAAANRYYQPGTFTTFIGYEWTSMPARADGMPNLHRNVIFAGDSAPDPFTSIDSPKPEDLWSYLEACRKQGFEALAIPHNANLSHGLMFDWVNSEGRPIDQSYAERRAANEPLFEIAQEKGQSETRPEISPNDEFANFELIDDLFMLDPRNKDRFQGGSYIRIGLARGIQLARQAGGVNPYKYGFVGASDNHEAQSDSSERATRYLNSAGLTGVWAEQNTRESIFAAFRRKETFATSGTRLKLRFFGGWEYRSNLLEDPRWLKAAYAQGVSMGGDLPERPARARKPRFLILAVKDPDSGNLDRAQIIKVWVEGGQTREQIFDVAISGGRLHDPKTGKVPPVGNTVDLKTATYDNRIGATQLRAVWEDPTFDPAVPTAYYLRVLEIPTPSWSTIQAAITGTPAPNDAPATVQERGWSSPIWYSPPMK